MSIKLMAGILRELENEPSTNAKEGLLRAAGEGIPHFKTMLQYALDPYKKFGIAVIPPSTSGGNKIASWEELQAILDKAVTREWTGTVLQSAVSSFMSVNGPSTNTVFKRVLLKDLRCGVGATLVNNVFAKLIPEFGIMLANPFQVHHINNIRKSKKAYHQAKKNGDRMVSLIPPRYGSSKGVSQNLTRKGHPLLNYNAILRSLEMVVDQDMDFRTRGVVFDSEVIKGDFFETRSTKKLAGNECEGAVAHVFDMVPLDQWVKRESDLYSVRRQQLAKIANGAAFSHFDNLTRVPSYPIEMEKLSVDYIDKLRDDYEAKGDEGVIIRLDEHYNFKSRSSMMKHKSMDTMDCLIEEVLPGEDDKKYANTAGKILVRLDDGETLCKAGLKLSDAERNEMWKNRSQYAGKVCEVAYQDKTVSKTGAPKLQFPVYKRLREDKS